MEQLERFQEIGRLMCELNKNLCGLEQTAKAWHDELTMLIQKKVYKQGKTGPCLFSKYKNGQHQYLLIYVDDLILCCKNKADEIVNKLNKEVEIKQLGEVKHQLGIEIERSKDGSFLLKK